MTIEDSVVARVVARVTKQAVGETDPVDPTLDEDVGELDIAEYIVFLLALDTYQRYVHEQTGSESATDDIIRKGVALMRMADVAHVDGIKQFLDGQLASPTHKKMLDKAFRYLPTAGGLSRRALQMRLVLSRGGAGTMRAVFKNNRALQAVRTAISASMVDDADAALDKFAVIPMRNARLRKWIDDAAEYAGSGTFQNAIAAGTKESEDDSASMFEAKVEAAANAPNSMAEAEASAKHDDLVLQVQQNATEAAKKALAVSGEQDTPPTKSEVIGIATAAAAALASNPEDEKNVPPPLKKLDPEQRAAAMTDGKVLVAAGAGAGKSTTLVARIQYLIETRRVSPSRIFAASFNRSAADGLKDKVAEEMGRQVMASVAIGTMHSLFRRFIRGGGGVKPFGTPAEIAMVSDENLIGKDDRKGKAGKKDSDEPEFVLDDEAVEQKVAKRKPPTGSQVTFALKGMLKDCGSKGLAAMTGFPVKLFDSMTGELSGKACKKLMENWRGNGIDYKTAREGAKTVEELLGSVWYELYLGLKGDLGPSWRPVCDSGTFGRFMKKFRPNGERLGDADDMVRIFRDILKRNPEAKKTAQGMYDHLLVDEAQDLNVVQHEIFALMTEHVQPGGKNSFWVVGDDKQSIYQFRGARPSLFSALDGAEGWTKRLIQTNYRCEPEVVDAANRVAQNNTGQIPMQAQADPRKARGKASIVVETPGDYVDGAYSVFETFGREMSLGKDTPADFAVLARTNAELNAFEDQCILREIPYKRAGGKGFLESPETRSVLGYMDLAMSSDCQELQRAFVDALTKPDRGLYLSAEAIEKIVQDAIKATALAENKDSRSFNPLDFLTRRPTARKLAVMIKAPYKDKMIAGAQALRSKYGNPSWLQDLERKHGGGIEWKFNEAVDELTDKLMEMGRQVLQIRMAVQNGAKTDGVLDMILDKISVDTGYYNKKTGEDTRKTTTLRDQIKEDRAFNADPEEDEVEKGPTKLTMTEKGIMREETYDGQPPELEDPLAGLGAVRYLYQLAAQNDKDKALGIDPSNGADFYRKIDRYKELSKELQDPEKYPERVTLSTVHSVKGAQWKNVAACMSYGFFPGKHKEEQNLIASELEKLMLPDPRDSARHTQAAETLASIREDRMTGERNLAYVALTRAKENLIVVSSQERVPPAMKAAGEPVLGPFIIEADLKIGENVLPPEEQKPVPPVPGVVPETSDEAAPAGPPPEPPLKFAFEDPDEAAEIERYAAEYAEGPAHTYNRRPS